LISILDTLTKLAGGIQTQGSQGDHPFWMPVRGSETAARIDGLFDFILWVSIFFFALIVILMVWFMIKYRVKERGEVGPPIYHNTVLEFFWTAIPMIIVVIMFWVGFKGYMDLVVPPANAYEIQVTGQKWKWLFTYPNGYVDDTLHVPADQPVTLVMTSTDVVHSMFIPAFRAKMDVFPGRYSKLWFEADGPGEYPIYCAEYCGTSHSAMLSQCIAHPPGEFETWLTEASNFLDTVSPEEGGKMLYDMRGCAQCHSIDGTNRIGPSFQGAFGAQRAFTDGTEGVVDENYIRESLLQPQSKVVAGYDGVMPAFQGRMNDQEIGALIAYIKSLQ